MELSKKHPRVGQFIEQQLNNPRCRLLTLEDFLIMPMVRRIIFYLKPHKLNDFFFLNNTATNMQISSVTGCTQALQPYSLTLLTIPFGGFFFTDAKLLL